MLAVALLAIVPHALEPGPDAALWILAGYLLVHLTQHVFTHHFHFGEETHDHAMVGRWVGITALLGLLLHTFFDGVAIASGFSVSPAEVELALHECADLQAAAVVPVPDASRGEVGWSYSRVAFVMMLSSC